MRHRLHQHLDYYERDRQRDPSRAVVCRERPISWPERPSPSMANFPSIPILWPMPMLVPMLPSFGFAGAMQSNYDEPYYPNRRREMSRCREESRGERCEHCGYFDCRCYHCPRCSQRDCECPGSGGSRPVKLTVHHKNYAHNYFVHVDQKSFDSQALPKVGSLATAPDEHGNCITIADAVVVHADADEVEIVITVDANSMSGDYSAPVSDVNNPRVPKSLGKLYLSLYT
jgi:hypothetical protein